MVGVPIEHIDAELLAAPLASCKAFSDRLVALDPRLKDATVPLWREAERDLLMRFPGMSVDDLLARRDHIWFDDRKGCRHRSASLRWCVMPHCKS